MERKYLIFNVSELDKINFNEVLETGPDTVRRSLDGTLTFVKWDSEVMPPSVSTLTTGVGPMYLDELRDILSGPEWTEPPVPKP